MTGASATTLVAHRGGQRDGDVDDVPTARLTGYLVYDGPRWIEGHRPTSPPRTVTTSRGVAQVGESVNG